jgi:2-polyprenyl-3-methyl-5-hydroxy-6-metoxy-1,4-benzoquinol methylase
LKWLVPACLMWAAPPGDFLKIAKESFLLSGMDISEGAITVAKSRNPELADRLWAGPVEDIAAGDKGPFDAIVLWDVIEHLWDPVRTCRSLLGHLAPNGLLVLSTPDSGAMAARLIGKRWAFMIPPEHLSLFSQQSFRHLFETKLPGEIVFIALSANRLTRPFSLTSWSGCWAAVSLLARWTGWLALR